MNNFKTRKKLLVAESEVYRELLKLEVQTFKVYSKRAKQRLTSVSTYLPFVMSRLPFLKGILGGNDGKKSKSAAAPPASSLQRMGALFLLGWKAYQRFRPFLSGNKFTVEDDDPTNTAAEEYLSKRL